MITILTPILTLNYFFRQWKKHEKNNCLPKGFKKNNKTIASDNLNHNIRDGYSKKKNT